MSEKAGLLVYQNNQGLLSFRNDVMQSINNINTIKFECIVKELGIKDVHETRDWRGNSLLHIAAERNNAEVASYLIKLEFDVNVQNEHGQTALMLALKQQNFAVVKVLLESDTDLCLIDRLGYNALRLIVAAEPGAFSDPNFISEWQTEYWPIVEMILEKIDKKFSSDAEQIANYLLQFSCPLNHAIFMDNSDVLRIMVEKGSPINMKDCYLNRTALHLAVQYWKLDKVKILLDRGADFNILNHYKKTPTMCIYDNITYSNKFPPREVELVQLLVKHMNQLPKTNNHNFVQQMYPIFRYGSKDAIQAVVEESFNDLFLAKDDNDFTLLHVLAENTNPGVGEVIRDRKLDLNGKSKYGQTALGHALEYTNCNMVEYLLSEGAITYTANSRDYSHRPWSIVKYHDPARFTRFCNYTGILQCLQIMLEYGQDQDLMCIYGTSQFTGSYLQSFMSTYNGHPGSESDKFVEPILAQFAIRKASGVLIPEVIYEDVQRQNRSKFYFNYCVQEVQHAKAIEIYKSVTVYEILTASNKFISVYACNRGLVSNLSKLVFELDPYYMTFLRKRFSKILQIAKCREEAERVVSQNIMPTNIMPLSRK